MIGEGEAQGAETFDKSFWINDIQQIKWCARFSK